MNGVQPPKSLQPTVRAAIVGARGFSGLELTRLILRHPHAKLVSVFGSGATVSSSVFSSELRGVSRQLAKKALAIDSVQPVAELFQDLDSVNTVFLATPAEVSLTLAPQLLAHGKKVIDLSGAFRLDQAGLSQHYKLSADAGLGVEFLQGGSHPAQYGLVPWSGPCTSNLIANPGCYVTSVLMAILPLLKQELIAPETLVIDAKSGVSGAGRKATEALSLAELSEDFYPYKVTTHQHEPEIVRYAREFSGAEIAPFFVTELLPIKRGISAAVFARLKSGVTVSQVRAAYAEAYSGYSLIGFGEIGTPEGMLSLKSVTGTAFTQLSFTVRGDQLYLFSLIDNLMKGAASQAIENLNRLNDLPVDTGLKDLEAVQ
jgi:N-acetyl-gamma-glutamyl-phosphate reductase